MTPLDERGAWVTANQPIRQTATAIGMVALGGLLTWALWGVWNTGWPVTSTSGWLMGVLLLGAGLAGGLSGGKETITVDTRRQHITIKNQPRWGGTRVRCIRFVDINAIEVGEMGDNEGGSTSYHVVLTLSNQQQVRLFFGFYEGQYQEATAQARCHRLLNMVGSTRTSTTV